MQFTGVYSGDYITLITVLSPYLTPLLCRLGSVDVQKALICTIQSKTHEATSHCMQGPLLSLLSLLYLTPSTENRSLLYL